MNCPDCGSGTKDGEGVWWCGSRPGERSKECYRRENRNLAYRISGLEGELQAYKALDAAGRINRE